MPNIYTEREFLRACHLRSRMAVYNLKHATKRRGAVLLPAIHYYYSPETGRIIYTAAAVRAVRENSAKWGNSGAGARAKNKSKIVGQTT